jgi:flagellar basal body P-ring protein FlgI
MTPRSSFDRKLFARRHFLVVGLAAFTGCTAPFMRGQSPDSELDAITQESTVRLVGDFVSPWGLNYLKIESIALVTGLSGTGSDPPPSPQRQRLVDEMQSHEVERPNEVLASPNTAMVLVRGYLPPGAQKGDRFDVEVLNPSRSETASLRGGWLMLSRLRQMEVLDNSIQTGHVVGLTQGPVLVDAVFETGDKAALESRGMVLGGGTVRQPRSLGLVIRGEEHSIMTTTFIGTALNGRFHTFDAGIKVGVATPKDNKFIELAVHPRYKNNISRYIRVVRNVAVRETPVERLARMELLQQQLMEPTSASLAALRLEAIGRDAIRVLQKGLRSRDAEVRFYSAEALAYLDVAEAAGPLAEAAKNEPAFRWHALTALATMDHVGAYEGLSELLHVTSAETRYGAFRAMQARNPFDPLVRGEVLSDQFRYHVISSTGEPMVHVARFRTPEIVVFGHEQRLNPNAVLFAGKEIMVKALDANRMKVSRFSPGKDDQSVECSTKLDDVIRAIAQLGGGYGDALQALQEAKQGNYLQGRLVLDAVPKPGRSYHRDENQTDETEPELTPTYVGTPLPDLFNQPDTSVPSERDERRRREEVIPDEQQPKRGLFGRMTNWFSG